MSKLEMPMNGSKMAAALRGRNGILRLRYLPSRGERFFIRAAVDVEAPAYGSWGKLKNKSLDLPVEA
jgi:hypothetical protein